MMVFCVEEYRLAHSWVKHYLSRAAINELSWNPPMAMFSNFTLSHSLFKRLDGMSYAMAIDSWKPSTVCYNCLADPNNLRDNDYTHFFHCNPVECIKFPMQQPPFREVISCAPAKEFNHPEECIYSEAKSIDWWWNELVSQLHFVIATIILTTSVAMAATWCCSRPCIRRFKA
jgi:hypothetical protein